MVKESSRVFFWYSFPRYALDSIYLFYHKMMEIYYMDFQVARKIKLSQRDIMLKTLVEAREREEEQRHFDENVKPYIEGGIDGK